MPPGGVTLEWKPSRRTLAQPGAENLEKPGGRKLVEEPQRKVFSMKEKRHLRQVESKEEYHDRPQGGRVVIRENGMRAADVPAREVDVTGEMARKARTLDLHGQRNGLGCRALGDKAYKHPEYDPGFHAEGGLVAGAGFVRGNFPKTEPRRGANVQLAASGRAKTSNIGKMTEDQVKAANRAHKCYEDHKSVNLADIVAVEEASKRLAEIIDSAVSLKVSKNMLLDAEDMRKVFQEIVDARNQEKKKTTAHQHREKEGAQRLFEEHRRQGFAPCKAHARGLAGAQSMKEVGVLVKWEGDSLKDSPEANYEDLESDEEQPAAS